MSPHPSQQQSHSSSLHYHRCWWAFCRHSFYSKVELLGHIDVEHVQNARPERLRDVPAHKLVEDDYWDSLDISSLPQMLSIPNPQKQVSSQGAPRESTPLDYIPSSLPSPPASTPQQVPSTPARVELVSLPVSPNTSPELIYKSPGFVNGPLTPSSRRDFTFSSLQSQSNSPSGYDVYVPDSPPFGRLVEEAISVTKSTRSASSCEDISGEKCSSQDSVFNQLTQNIFDEENGAEEINNTKNTEESEECMTADSSPHLSLVGDCLKTHTNRRSPTSSQTSPLSGIPHSYAMSYSHVVHLNSPSRPSPLANPIGIGTPMARQFWYQGFRRRSHRRTPVPDSGPSLLSLQRDTSTTSLEPRSEAVHPSIPAVSVVPPVSQSSSPAEQPQFPNSETQMDSQLTTSYPPLLTQAPYHSQDMTQSQD